MANGFFLGGAAEGMMGAQQQALKERIASDDTMLRGRGLDIQGRQLEHNIGQDVLKQADAQIAQTMAVAAETIKAGVEGGADPAKLRQTVMPLVQSAQSIAARIGRDPNALVAQIDAQLAAPTPVARAGVTGTAAGRARVAQEAAIQQVPLPPLPGTAAPTPGQATTAPAKIDVSPFTDPKDRVAAEAKMSDDYLTQAKPFITIRDNWSNVTALPGVTDESGAIKKSTTPEDFQGWTGANDLTLVFSFMKMVDPGSIVMPGERATAQNAAGVPEQVRAAYNNLLGGGVMSKGARKQMVDQAKDIYGTRSRLHDKLTTQFAQRAKRSGLRPENVILDLFPEGIRPTGTSGGQPITGRTGTGVPFTYRP